MGNGSELWELCGYVTNCLGVINGANYVTPRSRAARVGEIVGDSVLQNPLLSEK